MPLLLLLCATACAPAAAGGIETGVAPAVADPEPAMFLSLPDSVAWTAAPGMVITSDSTGREVPLDLFTRLEVLGRDSLGVRVACRVCGPAIEGRVLEGGLVADVLLPEVAAWGTLPEFLLAVRTAAANRDFVHLRPVMVADFTYAFIGIQTSEEAFAFWSAEDFWSLDELPGLLDRGVRTTDGRIWSAPPAFVSDRSYRGARAGFRRRADGRWEWVYLIRDTTDRR